jgi:hypothetical protein
VTPTRHLGRTVLASHATAAILIGITTGPTLAARPNGPGSAGQLALAASIYLVTSTLLRIGERHHYLPTARPASRSARLAEAGTVGLGVGAALALSIQPVLVLLLTAPLLLLHRALLPPPPASIDGKTGLLTATAWNHHAERELPAPRGALAPVWAC